MADHALHELVPEAGLLEVSLGHQEFQVALGVLGEEQRVVNEEAAGRLGGCLG